MAALALLLAAPSSAQPKHHLVIGPHPAKTVRQWQFRHRVTPYYGGGRFWSIPYSVVVCESGARVNDPAAPNGAYSLLASALQGVPTWDDWRPSWASGYALPYQAPKKAQDIAAHRLLVAYGLSPWECAGMVGLL